MAEPCTCPVGADECDGDFGVFLPLGHGGSCAVRPCQKPADRRQPEDERRVRWDAAPGVDSVHGWLFTTENVSDAEAAQSVLTGRTLEEIQRDIDGVMRRIDSAAGVTGGQHQTFSPSDAHD